MRRNNNRLVFHEKKKIITVKLIREIMSYVVATMIAIVLAYFTVKGFGQQILVVGDSMHTSQDASINNGQYVLIDRINYMLFSPKRGDVIAFLPNGNIRSHYYVKRVVGVPGDKLVITGGSLYINDELYQDVTYDKIALSGIAENEITLRSGEYFTLGDNINNSEDSRSANIGIVKKEMIFGKAWFKLSRGGNEAGFVK